MLAPGTLLQDRYLIVRLIAEGGMGAVYLARDQRLDSQIALKETRFTDERLSKAFEREARLLARLRHPALPRVTDHFIDEKGQFLIMEYIPGEDLGHDLKRTAAPFPRDNVLSWADQLLDVLEYLHSQQPPIVHRDIKPQNLKLTERGQIILLDFGLAKGMPVQMTRATSSGSIYGYTASYAPLEQIQGVGTDPRSDLYSLGATLYHLLTGVTPIDALTRAAAAVEGHSDPLRAVNELNELASISLGVVLHKAMALSRHRRYETAAQMRAAMRHVGQYILDSGNAQTLIGAPIGLGPIAEQPTTKPEESVPSETTQRDSALLESHSGALAEQVPADTSYLVNGPAATGLTSPPDSPIGLAPTGAHASGLTEADSRAMPHEATGRITLLGRHWVIGVALIIAILVCGALLYWPSKPASGPPTPLPPLRTYEFDMATLDGNAIIKERRKGHARYFTEDIGGASIDMVEIPGGKFLMGSPESEAERFSDEGPQHQVSMPSFFMSEFEITQAQWRTVASFLKANRKLDVSPSYFKGDDRPVEQVSWEDAAEFCERLSQATGREYRLPTESEWEYACRSGTATPFAFGETITDDLVNYNGNHPYGLSKPGIFRGETTVAGSLRVANGFGLYDMHGNVWEWCLDPWHDSYIGAPTDDAMWQGGDDTYRVQRGGSWSYTADNCRTALRNHAGTTVRSNYVGFRVVAPVRK